MNIHIEIGVGQNEICLDYFTAYYSEVTHERRSPVVHP